MTKLYTIQYDVESYQVKMTKLNFTYVHLNVPVNPITHTGNIPKPDMHVTQI